MKSFKIAIVLLIIIVISSFIYIYSLNKTSQIFLDKLDALEDMIEDDNWDSAEKQLEDMQERWKKTEKWMTTLIDHQEVDDINLTFARLSQYLYYRETAGLMAESASLKLLIKHIPKKEKVNFSNLL